MAPSIYLDHQATTPCDPRVVEAMLPYFSTSFANASSVHPMGKAARNAVETARAQVAALLNAQPEEILFTSGATESNALALLGYARANQDKGRRIVSAKTEHVAVLDTLKYLQSEGFEVTWLPVNVYGGVDPETLKVALKDTSNGPTLLVTLMGANNEVGTLNDHVAYAIRSHEAGAVYHSDMAQVLAHAPIDVSRAPYDLISLSGHKIYGPKGVGALWVRQKKPRLRLSPLLLGGGQERGLRSGTLPVPLIVGMGKACEIVMHEQAVMLAQMTILREQLWQGLKERIPDLRLHGHPQQRLAGNLHVTIPSLRGISLVEQLETVCASSGSSCKAAYAQASHVLTEMGVAEDEARGALRFSVGRGNTSEDIHRAVEEIVRVVHRLQGVSE